MVECICDYTEAMLLSTTGGMDKDKKDIIHYIGQQKVQTKNIAELQQKHHNCPRHWIFLVRPAAIRSLCQGCQERESHTLKDKCQKICI